MGLSREWVGGGVGGEPVEVAILGSAVRRCDAKLMSCDAMLMRCDVKEHQWCIENWDMQSWNSVLE